MEAVLELARRTPDQIRIVRLGRGAVVEGFALFFQERSVEDLLCSVLVFSSDEQRDRSALGSGIA